MVEHLRGYRPKAKWRYMTTPVNAFLEHDVAARRDSSWQDNLSSRFDDVAEYVDSIEGLMQIRREWISLELLFGNPLLTHNWFASLAASFPSQVQPEIILIRRDGEIKAIAPLALKGGLVKRLEILGSFATGEPGGVLFTDGRSIDDLWRAVVDMKSTTYLKGFRFGSPETRTLESLLRSSGIRFLAREEKLPWISTNGKFEDYERKISSSRRSSFRRLRRLAESEGKLEFEVKTPSPENVDALLTEFFSVEASSWKGRTGTAMKSYSELGTFFREYSRLEAAGGRLRIFLLKVGGKTIAGQLTDLRSNRLWIFKIGHDEAWSWCSPGILLMNEVVKFCFESGLDACELLGSDEPWLHIWTNEAHTVVTYRIYPRTIAAVPDLLSDVAINCAKRITTMIAKRRKRRRKYVKENERLRYNRAGLKACSRT